MSRPVLLDLFCGAGGAARGYHDAGFDVIGVGNWDGFELLPPCRCHRNRDLLPFMHKGERAYADAMGCTWMSKESARQAIPPAYTRFIGEQLMAHLTAGVTS